MAPLISSPCRAYSPWTAGSEMPKGTHSSPMDPVTVVVDTRSESIFELPYQPLRTKSTYFDRALSGAGTSQQASSKDLTKLRVEIPNIYTCDFYDFTQWLYTGRILSLPHNRTPYAVEFSARRLAKALTLGIFLGSEGYQWSAMSELHALGHNLARPEELVNPIFAATVDVARHPARKLVVAMVATSTSGKGRSNVEAPGEKVVRRGERIKQVAFWEMYDEYCVRRMGNCKYPATLQEAVS